MIPDLRWLDRLLAGEPVNGDARSLEEAFHALALGAPPAPPTRGARARLMASVERERFAPFVGRLAALFDLSADAVRELLEALRSPDTWLSLSPEVELVHLTGGPATAGAHLGLVRVAVGGSFPHHEHPGEERVLVMQGLLQEPDGRVFGPGSVILAPAGSGHVVRSVGDEPLVWAVVTFGAANHDRSDGG